MAPLETEPGGEEAWREAWVDSQYTGQVELAKDAESGQEQLIVRCKAVLNEYNAEAEVLDDGRTVGVGIGDTVAFGVIARPGKSPMAVNIWRAPAKKKRKRAAEDEGPQLPSSLVGELTGVVRNQSQKSGDYFIACKKVYDVFQRDAKIFQTALPDGIDIGDAIYFEVEPPPNETAAPLAKAIRKAPRAAAEGVLAQGGPRGGKGFSKGDRISRGADMPRRFFRKPGTTMRMVGIVKRTSEYTNRHFIFCQDISDVYGKDAQIPREEVPAGGLSIGDRIAFDIDEPSENRPTETPLAFNIKILGSAGSKRRAPLRDIGDGEEEGEGEAEDAEAMEEPLLEKDDQEEDELAADLADGAGRTPKRPKPRRPSAAGADGDLPEPETKEDWEAAQERLFAGLPKLPLGWIRIRSKTRGLIYYYNKNTGTSTPHEPKV